MEPGHHQATIHSLTISLPLILCKRMFTRDKGRRDKVLEFVRSYTEEHGFAPSIREIAKAVGVRSTKAVKYHLDILVNEGLLKHPPAGPRSADRAPT
jgi:SOS-response transcriptional repressor LexA